MCHAKLSRSAGRVPDPMLVRLAAENYGMKLDGLVTARKISPAVARRLKAQYIGRSGQALALSLSQGPHGRNGPRRADPGPEREHGRPRDGREERPANPGPQQPLQVGRARSGDEASDRVHV